MVLPLEDIWDVTIGADDCDLQAFLQRQMSQPCRLFHTRTFQICMRK